MTILECWWLCLSFQSCLHLFVPVGLWKNLIDSHHPSLRGVCFSEILQIEVLQSNFTVSNCVITWRLIASSSHFPKSIVAESVHQTFLHGWRSIFIYPIVPFVKVVVFLDLREYSCSNSNHPQELGYIVTRVIRHSSKNNEHIIGIKIASYLVSFFFWTRHGSANGRNVRVVPCVVINNYSSVWHASDLVSVIPPRHDFGGLWSVLFQPIVSLSVVINDVARTILTPSR